MSMDQPTTALLHKVVATEQGPDGSHFSVGYAEDPDGHRRLIFATSSRFGELGLFPLMEGQVIALTPGSLCLEVLPLDQQSLEVQLKVACRRDFGR